MLFLSLTIFLSSSSLVARAATPCDPFTSSSGIVCRCNATYCDTVDPLVLPPTSQYLIYTTSLSGQRLSQSSGNFTSRPPSDAEPVLTINFNQQFQKIIGFGGAFTDASTMNMMNLSKDTSAHLFQSYYSPTGIEYTLGRIVISSCDYSTHVYSYDDYPGDFNLTNFSLTVEDFNFKIPAILTAQSLSSRPIKLFGSAWSAPGWMKTNGKMYGRGSLIGVAGNEYHKTWALYYSKFLDAYKKEGVNVWAITTQNEPMDGCIPDFTFQAMCFTAETQRDFVEIDLGPHLEATHPNVLILMYDGQRGTLAEWTATVLSNTSKASSYIDGIALHWYEDFFTSPELLNATHYLYPDKFLLGTEACLDFTDGAWYQAEAYAVDIINDLNNWVSGWTDWNLALNMSGGPNWADPGNSAPILVDISKDVFYKGPIFYILGHFSKFILPDSIRVGYTLNDNWPKDLLVSVFQTPAKYSVLQIYNRANNGGNRRVGVNVNDGSNRYMEFSISPQSLQTYIIPAMGQ